MNWLIWKLVPFQELVTAHDGYGEYYNVLNQALRNLGWKCGCR